MTLKGAIDKDTFELYGTIYTDELITAMSLDELEEMKMLIIKKLSGYSSSLRRKQIEYRYNGKGSKPQWYLNIKSAQSINQRVLQYVNNIIKKRVSANRKLGDYFIDKARAYLSPEDFEYIIKTAQKEMREELNVCKY